MRSQPSSPDIENIVFNIWIYSFSSSSKGATLGQNHADQAPESPPHDLLYLDLYSSLGTTENIAINVQISYLIPGPR